MIRTKLWAGVAVAASVMALAVFSPGGGTDVTEAKGPAAISVSYELQNGAATPGSLGVAIATRVDLAIDAGGQPPSSSAFFDTTVTRSSGTETTRGPNHPGGGGMDGSDIGAGTGVISFSITTNAFGTSGFAGDLTAPTHYGVIAACGDNDDNDTTRNYLSGGAAANAQLTIAKSFSVFIGNMEGKDTVLADSGAFGGTGFDGNDALYAHNGGDLIQTYDDDDNDGIPGSKEVGGPASEPEDAIAAIPVAADPWTINAGTYTLGTPETQHDTDDDGLPDGHELMPDFLPLLAETIGLRTFWEGRSYGIANVFNGLVPATDVHFMGFADVPGIGGVTFTVLANPFTPANPASQALSTCPPFTTSVDLDANTSLISMCDGGCNPLTDNPPGVSTGDAVSVTSNVTGAQTIALFVTDGDDYDVDGRVGGIELCARDSAGSNTAPFADADGDLITGLCDPAPASWDNDADTNATTGDRGTVADLTGNLNCDAGASKCDNDVDEDDWINNVDNCETISNIDQDDDDADGVGDACDNFTTTDSIALTPAGKGAGTGTNTSDNIDNDLLCSRSWTPPAAMTLGAATCTNQDDANDDGIPDVDSDGSDEDGDGLSDQCESRAAVPSNVLNPNEEYHVANPSGVPAGSGPTTDSDGDHLLDLCEDEYGTTVGDDDTDNDGVEDGIETAQGTNPLAGSYPSGAVDDDGDGCTNDFENNADVLFGDEAQERHPGSWWDNYDTNGTGDIDVSDTLVILGKFGVSYVGGGAYTDPAGQRLDRGRRILPGPPGGLAEANNGIDLADALANLAQFGWAGCVAPGAVPAEGGGIFN